MGELEDAQGRSDVLRVDLATRGQRRGDGGGFVSELGLFRRQGRLIDRSREVRGQESFLHGLDLGGSFLEGHALLALDVAGVLERRLQRPVEPVGQFAVRDADGFEVGHDGVLQVIAPPAHARMVFGRIVVRAPVVIVRSNAAALQLAFDPFARDQRAAVLAGEEATSQRHVDLRRRSPNLAVEQVLALRERPSIDEWSMLPGEISFAPFDLADVDAVPQHP